MSINNIPPLPSDKQFGIFLSFIFLLITLYFFIFESTFWVYSLFFCFLFFLFSFFKPAVLHRLNFLWMQLGLLLGKFANPLVLCFIYFFLITPLSLCMRLTGRDPLRIKKQNVDSFFIAKSNLADDSFKNQY